MKTAVSTIIYGHVVKLYLKDFLQSIQQQSDQDFDIVVVAQGITEREIRNSCLLFAPDLIGRLKIYESPEIDSYNQQLLINNQIRYNALKELGIECAIGFDCDDKINKDHIAIMKNALIEHDADVIFCDLDKFSHFESKSKLQLVFNDRFQNGYQITFNDLKEGNCLGFGNTAYKPSKLKKVMDTIKEGDEALDWLLHSLIVETGGKIVYTTDTHIDYRVHSDNMSELGHKSIDHALKSIKTIQQHFKILSANPLLPDDKEKYQTELSTLDLETIDTSLVLNSLLSAKSLIPEYPLWWEQSMIAGKLMMRYSK